MTKSRYFLHISYHGGDFSGWQKQNNANSVQETIEQALRTLLREPITVMGCGRTDSGVHASSFFLHFDAEQWDQKKSFNLNSILPKTIAVHGYYKVEPTAHVRFDAVERSYIYRTHANKDPFKKGLSARIVGVESLSVDKLNEVAKLLLEFKEFAPFCKTNHDANTLRCNISHAAWTRMDDNSLQFDISSNRFLRGMVRLIVGACIYVAQDKISVEEVRKSLETQTMLSRPWSVPAEGLYLSKVVYPYID